MTEHVEHADLVGLVRGEIDTAHVVFSRLHLDGCTVCLDELVDVVVGHALAARTATTLAAPSGGPRHRPIPTELDAALPALRSPRNRLMRAPVLVAAACVALAAIFVGVLQSDDAPDPLSPPVAATTLEPLGDSGGGSVEITGADGGGSRLAIEVHDLPALGDGQYYYAWLLDPATNKMLPLGQVGTTGDAAFELRDGMVDAYSAVDVSLEDDDGDPDHSPTSVLRAAYP